MHDEIEGLLRTWSSAMIIVLDIVFGSHDEMYVIVISILVVGCAEIYITSITAG